MDPRLRGNDACCPFPPPFTTQVKGQNWQHAVLPDILASRPAQLPFLGSIDQGSHKKKADGAGGSDFAIALPPLPILSFRLCDQCPHLRALGLGQVERVRDLLDDLNAFGAATGASRACQNRQDGQSVYKWLHIGHRSDSFWNWRNMNPVDYFRSRHPGNTFLFLSYSASMTIWSNQANLHSAICYGLIARHFTTNKCKAPPRQIQNLGLCEVRWCSTLRWTGRA